MTNPNPAAPLTEAGRRLLGLDMGPEEAYWVNLGSNEMRTAILAIEQEAAARATSTPAGPDEERLADTSRIEAAVNRFADSAGLPRPYATSTPAGLTAKTILQTIAEAEKGWAALLAVDTSHLPTITHDEYVAQWLDYYALQGADR